MVNRSVVAAKLAELDRRIHRVKQHTSATAAELASDQDALELVAFNLMLAVQICADLASHIIADSGWSTARTLGAAFASLQQHGVLAPATSAALARAAGLRNVVAHGYSGIDVAMVHAAATQGLVDLQSFAQEVAAWAGRQP